MKTKIKTKSFTLSVLTEGDRKAKKIAIIIPGRLDTKDYIHVTSHMKYLSKKGFFAISFDPPGTWESEGKIDIYNTTNYIKAVNELIDYYGNKPTLLVGHSRGGSISILCSSNPSVSGIILIMASYGNPSPPEGDVKKGYRLSLRDFPPGNKVTKEKKEFKLPMSYFEDGNKYDPTEFLKGITKPKLIIYSKRDQFSNPGDVKKLYEEIPNPKMICEIDSEHDYRYSSKAVEEVNKAIEKFFDGL